MKIKYLKLIVCLLVFFSIISAIGMTAYALDWDGSSSGGTGAGSPAGPNGYAIRTTGDNCLGYRFSVVNKNGNNKGTKVIDVFRNTSYGNMEYSGAYKFNSKQNKKQLINNQNNGFGTSKTTSNCFKEANMGFASSLPVPSGMNGWQNDSRNLNAILSTVGIGNVENLKNGDKILVEPLFDVRLQGTYHSVTVTELALYGKYILGANSNGGGSSTSASWGFIAGYTNKIYPNALYTPDGQGLWSGVGALSKQGTFYTIINSGYGVGIAYTETRPDFTPTLSVTKCEAWPGNKSVRNNNHYGISYGSSFGNYVYGNGYPVLSDKVWFAVNFPAESENCYVRQTVWVDGGGSTTRNVYSHSGTWYDVALSPTMVDTGRSSYIVKARVDWIDGNGNTLKWGAEKTFYIPVKPKIDRYQVKMYDIVGNTSAYNGSSGSSGSVYVGQRTRAKYTYTSQNAWTSYNYLRGRMYKWSNNAWNSYSGGTDLYVDNAGINKSYAYSKYSDIGQFRVPDNSANANGGNQIPFYMWTHWASDIDHTSESTWYDIPVVKADAALEDIKLIDENGNYITGRNVWENQLVTPQYIYRNNTDCTIYVEGYNDDVTKINGIYAIPANSEIAVNGKQLRVGHGTAFYVWGGVYLEGAGRSMDWEKEDYESQNNNHWLKYWYVQNPLTIQAITPNSSYREGVEVVTSFRVYNASPTAFIPSDNVMATITVYNASVYGGRDIRYVISPKMTVIPGNSSNLVYLKWTVPKHLGSALLDIVGTVQYNGKVKDTDVLTVDPVVLADSQTPDTSYEASKPSGWSASSVTSPYANTAYWSEWIYQNGGFVLKSYGLKLSTAGLTIAPDSNSPSAIKTNDIWSMKSGYGFSLGWTPSKETPAGRSAAPASMITSVQNGYAMFPEYNYSTLYGKYRSLDNLSSWGSFVLKTNTNAEGNRRIHFVPVWYPNGTQNYTVSAYAYDCWTPAGMISSRVNSNSMSITGSLYDDYYIGRGN